jgi:hypothetical protein
VLQTATKYISKREREREREKEIREEFRVLQTGTKKNLEGFRGFTNSNKMYKRGREKRVCGNKGFYKQQQTN